MLSISVYARCCVRVQRLAVRHLIIGQEENLENKGPGFWPTLRPGGGLQVGPEWTFGGGVRVPQSWQGCEGRG